MRVMTGNMTPFIDHDLDKKDYDLITRSHKVGFVIMEQNDTCGRVLST